MRVRVQNFLIMVSFLVFIKAGTFYIKSVTVEDLRKKEVNLIWTGET